MAVRRIVVDALQVSAEPTGVGRQAAAIGAALHDLPDGIALELRCALDAAPLLGAAFPPGTRVATPVRSSRPRRRRILVQQLAALRDGPDTLLVALGDQAPLAGRARLLLVVNDARRLDPAAPAGRGERAWYRLLLRRGLRRAHVLATISASGRDELRRLTGRDAVVVPQHPEPRAQEPAASPDGAPLLAVGALRPYKGLDTLVDALALLPRERRPPLVVAGPDEGAAAALRRRAAAAGVALELRGWVDDEELERLYAGALALIAPSRYEGYDLPLAEALGRGLPAVASAIPPHLEVAGDAALLFPPGDADALAERLRELADPARRRELGARALERARELAREPGGWRETILAAAQ